MLTKKIVIDYLEDSLGKGKTTSTGVKFCCPHCDAGQKFNLEVNLLSEDNPKKYLKFNCWSCKYSGSITKLLTDYANTDSWELIKEIQNLKTTKPNETVNSLVGNKKVVLPSLVLFYLSEKIKDYLLKERGLDFEVLLEKKISYAYQEDEDLYDKILFPFFENKECIGFSTQDFKTKKYRNHRALDFIPFKEFINEKFPIILTEGIYDALSVPNAIPLLGTNISDVILSFCRDKKVILAMDREVSIEMKLNYCEKLYFYGAKAVVIFELNGYKDLNDYLLKNKESLKENLKNTFQLLLRND